MISVPSREVHRFGGCLLTFHHKTQNVCSSFLNKNGLCGFSSRTMSVLFIFFCSYILHKRSQRDGVRLSFRRWTNHRQTAVESNSEGFSLVLCTCVMTDSKSLCALRRLNSSKTEPVVLLNVLSRETCSFRQLLAAHMTESER